MLIECNRCGAPLDVGSGRRVVQCVYCGSYSRTKVAKTLAVDTPADFRQPETWTPPQEAKARSVPLKRKKRSAAPKIAVAAGAVMVLGAGFAFLGSGGGDAWLREWYSTPCLVDANGDEVLDVAGLAASPGSSSWGLAVVDGKDGSRLWDGESFSVDGTPSTLCVGGSMVGVVAGDFRARFYDTRASDRPPVVVPLSDRANEYGAGPGCVRIGTADGSVQSVALPSGEVVPECAATAMTNIHVSPNLRDEDQSLGITEGETSWVLSARERGTPFLRLRRETGAAQDWVVELQHVAADSDNLAMQKMGDLLVIYASDPTDDDYGVLLGVDANDGALRYAMRQGSHWSGRLRDLTANQRYVLAFWGFGLHAYDPATGERVWNIGGR